MTLDGQETTTAIVIVSALYLNNNKHLLTPDSHKVSKKGFRWNNNRFGNFEAVPIDKFRVQRYLKCVLCACLPLKVYQ